MTMPVQKPGRSKQDYATPRKFIAAVERRFGQIAFDLAANQQNKVCPRHYGPGSAYAEDSLTQYWSRVDGLLWLNPPYSDIALWAKKCMMERNRDAGILFLVPASVGSNWYWDFVVNYADVYVLSPRLSFNGKSPYPKDLILAHYHSTVRGPNLYRWWWKP